MLHNNIILISFIVPVFQHGHLVFCHLDLSEMVTNLLIEFVIMTASILPHFDLKFSQFE